MIPLVMSGKDRLCYVRTSYFRIVQCMSGSYILCLVRTC
jgi:hypothetical protein